jgi:hypothetical protein
LAGLADRSSAGLFSFLIHIPSICLFDSIR